MPDFSTTVRTDPAAVSPSGVQPVSVVAAAARAAGYREALAEMATWLAGEEVGYRKNGDLLAVRGADAAAAKVYDHADIHARAARHAKALAAAADDPAGPLPVRVRYRVDVSDPSYVSLRVFIGPEHGAALCLNGIVRADDLPAIRAGWPGAAFIEEASRGTG